MEGHCGYFERRANFFVHPPLINKMLNFKSNSPFCSLLLVAGIAQRLQIAVVKPLAPIFEYRDYVVDVGCYAAAFLTGVMLLLELIRRQVFPCL